MPRRDQTLDAKIELAEMEGWKLSERKENLAVMKKKTWGSKWIHLVLLITFGVGNVAYGLYRRLLKPKKMIVHGQAFHDIQNEAQKRENERAREKRLAAKEANKNTREAVRTFRKFF